MILVAQPPPPRTPPPPPEYREVEEFRKLRQEGKYPFNLPGWDGNFHDLFSQPGWEYCLSNRQRFYVVGHAILGVDYRAKIANSRQRAGRKANGAGNKVPHKYRDGK